MGCAKVPPGYVGIQINMLGKDRGVDSCTKVSGLVFYNAFTTNILEYPTFVQTAVWTKDAAEGEAKSNQILTQSLSPTLLEWRRLEIAGQSVHKWNGALPQYMGGNQPPFITIPVK